MFVFELRAVAESCCDHLLTALLCGVDYDLVCVLGCEHSGHTCMHSLTLSQLVSECVDVTVLMAIFAQCFKVVLGGGSVYDGG